MTRADLAGALADALAEARQWVHAYRFEETHDSHDEWAAIAERLVTPGVAEAFGLSIRDDAGREPDR